MLGINLREQVRNIDDRTKFADIIKRTANLK